MLLAAARQGGLALTAELPIRMHLVPLLLLDLSSPLEQILHLLHLVDGVSARLLVRHILLLLFSIFIAHVGGAAHRFIVHNCKRQKI